MCCSAVNFDCMGKWRLRAAGSGVDCGCWLVVELQKWKVNELVTFEVKWQKLGLLEGLRAIYKQGYL